MTWISSSESSGITSMYNPSSMRCLDESRPIERGAGCIQPLPSSIHVIKHTLKRTTDDVYPYNSCEVDENVSFRQYVEGFLKQDNPYAPLGSFAEVNAALAGIGQHAGKSFHPCATCTVRIIRSCIDSNVSLSSRGCLSKSSAL